MSQVPVNIVYPIDGANYPIGGGIQPGIQSLYFAASFSVTCKGGAHTVKWGFDGNGIGEAQFYDEFTAQFTYKLGAGAHVFFVSSDCGDAKVEFKISS